MVRTYANVEHILIATKDVERVFNELGETPFEPLKEEQKERCTMTHYWPRGRGDT
jgi:hypothetical protein